MNSILFVILAIASAAYAKEETASSEKWTITAHNTSDSGPAKTYSYAGKEMDIPMMPTGWKCSADLALGSLPIMEVACRHAGGAMVIFSAPCQPKADAMNTNSMALATAGDKNHVAISVSCESPRKKAKPSKE